MLVACKDSGGGVSREICIQMWRVFGENSLICSDRVMSGSASAVQHARRADANFPVHYINIRKRRRVGGGGAAAARNAHSNLKWMHVDEQGCNR